MQRKDDAQVKKEGKVAVPPLAATARSCPAGFSARRASGKAQYARTGPGRFHSTLSCSRRRFIPLVRQWSASEVGDLLFEGALTGLFGCRVESNPAHQRRAAGGHFDPEGVGAEGRLSRPRARPHSRRRMRLSPTWSLMTLSWAGGLTVQGYRPHRPSTSPLRWSSLG